MAAATHRVSWYFGLREETVLEARSAPQTALNARVISAYACSLSLWNRGERKVWTRVRRSLTPNHPWMGPSSPKGTATLLPEATFSLWEMLAGSEDKHSCHAGRHVCICVCLYFLPDSLIPKLAQRGQPK